QKFQHALQRDVAMLDVAPPGALQDQLLESIRETISTLVQFTHEAKNFAFMARESVFPFLHSISPRISAVAPQISVPKVAPAATLTPVRPPSTASTNPQPA